MLALTIPWVLMAFFFAIVLFLFKKKWRIALLMIIVALLVNAWAECIPFRLYKTQTTDRGASLDVMCFNCDGSTGDYLVKAKQINVFLEDHFPDIVFITEFDERQPRKLDSILSKQYPYSTFPDRLLFNYFYGTSPFFNHRKLIGPEGEYIGVYACSTTFQGDTIDLYGCHFASNNYDSLNERLPYDKIDNKNDLWHYIKNVRNASKRRKLEAEMIVQEMSKSTHEAVVLGDLNDVCGSYSLRILEAGQLKDCWWEGGIGYGATIHKPFPYRIDHILHTNRLKLENIRFLDSKGISDHAALKASFVMR